jgi:hypothetical protein
MVGRRVGAVAKTVSPILVCDPWAGTGFLVGVLREMCQPETTWHSRKSKPNTQLERFLSPRPVGSLEIRFTCSVQ